MIKNNGSHKLNTLAKSTRAWVYCNGTDNMYETCETNECKVDEEESIETEEDDTNEDDTNEDDRFVDLSPLTSDSDDEGDSDDASERLFLVNIGSGRWMFVYIGSRGLTIFRRHIHFVRKHWECLRHSYVPPPVLLADRVYIPNTSGKTYLSYNLQPCGLCLPTYGRPASWEGGGAGCTATVCHVPALSRLGLHDGRLLRHILDFLSPTKRVKVRFLNGQEQQFHVQMHATVSDLRRLLSETRGVLATSMEFIALGSNGVHSLNSAVLGSDYLVVFH